MIVGTAVLVLAPALLTEQTDRTNARQPDAASPPAIVGASAPLPSAAPRNVAPIELTLADPAFTHDAASQASAVDFVAASGEVGSVPTETEDAGSALPTRAVEKPAAIAPEAPAAPQVATHDVVAATQLGEPQAPAAGVSVRPVDTVRLAALPPVSLSRSGGTSQAARVDPPAPDEQTDRVPGAGLARPGSALPSWGQASAYPLGYGGETGVTALDLTGDEIQARTIVTRFGSTGLSASEPPLGSGSIRVWLETETSSDPPVAAAGKTARATSAPVRLVAGPDPGRAADVSVVEQAKLERQVQRLLRQQLRELRRR